MLSNRSNFYSSFSFISWNVRGLGDSKKCDIVKEILLQNSFDIVLLQETELSDINHFKSATFLASSLQNFITVEASNASRGILTAWNSSNLKLTSSITKTFSISAKFESESNGSIFWVTNFYGPNEGDRPSFIQELKDLTNLIQDPWMMAGDFNSVCSPLERTTHNMTPNENLFNNMIWDLSLQEIPLLDRAFTWSSMQNPLILSKLDRILINVVWNSQLSGQHPSKNNF
jgi:exonuclease III